MSNLIYKISFSYLRKEEIKTLASRVITIVEKHDPENLKINEIFDLLVELQPQIESLDLGYIAHPVSETLNELRKQRIAFAQGLINQMGMIEKGKLTGMEESLKVAKPIVLQHLQSLSKYSNTKVYQNINSFARAYMLSLPLQTAIETLKLSSYFDNLLNVNQIIESHNSNRTQDYSKREKGDTVRKVATIVASLRNLFKEIEVSKVKNQELDYKPLVDELNQEIVLTKAILKTRSSYYKKKAEGLIDDNEVVVDIDNDESEVPSEPETTEVMTRMFPAVMKENMVNGGVLDELDLKKTVAMNS